jgi:hypothetical protein
MTVNKNDRDEMLSQLYEARAALEGIKREARRLDLGGTVGNMDMALSYVVASISALEK